MGSRCWNPRSSGWRNITSPREGYRGAGSTPQRRHRSWSASRGVLELSLPGGSLPSFLERARSIADHLSRLDRDDGILVVTHLDADGLSAGSIMLQALLGMGFSPMIRVVKQLDEEVISEISASPH